MRLFILRHAKSSWAVPGASDFERELNKRGFSDLPKIAAEMASQGYRPETVLCSPATRTRQTLEGVRSVLAKDCDIRFEQILYSGGAADYLSLLHSVEEPKSIMIVGHNPMCGTLAAMLPGGGDEAALAEISYKYPTGAVAVIDFEGDAWSAAEKGKGILSGLILPRKIPGDSD